MKHILKSIVLSLLCLLASCKEKEPVNPCNELEAKLRGHYEVRVTLYPRQPSQEGDSKEVRTYLRLDKCRNYGTPDLIYFYNLFEFFNCSHSMELIDDHRFIITYDDGHEWAGAPVKGEGTVIDEKFNFTGTVSTSEGEFPIVLDGSRVSSTYENNICW
jgi:hypothetical protein